MEANVNRWTTQFFTEVKPLKTEGKRRDILKPPVHGRETITDRRKFYKNREKGV